MKRIHEKNPPPVIKRDEIDYSYCDVVVGTLKGKALAYERILLDPRKVLRRVKLFDEFLEAVKSLHYQHMDIEIECRFCLLIEKAKREL